MLTSLIKFSLTQRLFVSIITLITIIVGINAWFSIPIDAFPDISPTQVKIVLKAPGMTSVEIESQVTRVIETELLGIPQQAMLRSTTKYSITDITIDFQEGTDIYWARQQVNERLMNIWSSLPESISGGMAPMSTPLSEMFMFSVENPNLSLTERRELLDWQIRPLLRTVPGVADVNTLGGFVKTYEISADVLKMQQLNTSFNDIASVLALNNINRGLGRLIKGNDTLILRTQGRIEDIAALSNLVIKSAQGGDQIVRLSDIAEINIGHLTRYGAVTKDGKETTQGLIIALKNSNTAEVVSQVKSKLAEIIPSLPKGTKVNVFYDRSTLINTAIGTITSALTQAVILVIIILALFFGDLRSSIVVSLSLPLAALMTFILMKQFDLSANLMSLGGLVIAIGMLVDASVVIVENIVNQLSRNQSLPRLHVIFRACKEVATPVSVGTIIVLIVFSPLLTLTGLEGKLFTPVALTIVFAMISALLLSLTVIPILASLSLKNEAVKDPKLVITLQSFYQKSLKQTLAAPKKLMFTLISILLISLVLFGSLGKSFMPLLDEGDIIVQLEKSPSISLLSSVAIDNQIEQDLLNKIPEIKQIVARTGSDELGLDPMGLNETDVFMELAPSSEWRFDTKAELIEDIRKVLANFPGINIGFTQPIQMRVSEMLTGSTGDVSIKVFGNDMNILAELANNITAVVNTTLGSSDVKAAIIEGGKYVNIKLIPEIAAQSGMSTQALSSFLQSQLEELTISKILNGNKSTAIVFGKNNPSIASLAELKASLILMPNNQLLPLETIARVSFKKGPLLIEREKGNRFVSISTNVVERDVVGFVDELSQKITEKVNLPSGYTLAFGGEYESQQRATHNLLIVVPVSLILIFIILFTTFNSLAKSGLILANIPFAVMGGIIALFISGEYLSVPASVGFIALLGVAVANGVVMLSYFEQTKMLVRNIEQRVVIGANRRLRPILMTATTGLVGLLPLAFATGPGAEIQKPLAIVVIGGLITSTITTLYLLPLFYCFMERNITKKQQEKN
ncbi:efflux RND transporter permease subunit [Colwellia sp. Bg11-12]|uniref:efflux RND transporter permease subunit n=1 Tax=Colwellia sp. Bg11-12 TaxID=2759817 RepID=UPI0015F5546C|nr:CusA/CzcA family heavy metal efflux RND transporter [Colwellia sp. Bg11-12]MBA6265613.1 efflux RND transporter permease subunit [Colwellia sp. Bg11-12]